MSIKSRVEDLPNGTRVIYLSGCITEEADFQPIFGMNAGQLLRIDLADIERINSCGVREWIHFVSQLSRDGANYELARCSPSIVRQLNMISNFKGSGTVHSVMLPYYCSECQHEVHRTFEISGSGEQPTIDDTLPCPKCGAVAEFDDITDTYLGFLD